MEFKGHTNFRILSFDSGKLTISSKGKDKDFICHEYHYSDYKLIKHIDFINWRVSHHTYNENKERIELRTFSFDENPEIVELKGYKNFVYENGNVIRENHFVIYGKEEKLEYEGKYIYSGKNLIREEFHYPNEIYIIKHHFNEKRNLLTTVFPNESVKCEYYFDENKFLKKFINFKENNYCQINEYEYKLNRLHKLTEYPILKFKKNLFSNKIKLVEKEQFIHENEFFYDDRGMLIKEVKTDIIDNYEIDVLRYEYQK